jgi:hypothetical protein
MATLISLLAHWLHANASYTLPWHCDLPLGRSVEWFVRLTKEVSFLPCICCKLILFQKLNFLRYFVAIKTSSCLFVTKKKEKKNFISHAKFRRGDY